MTSVRRVSERPAAVWPVPEHGRGLDVALRIAAYVVLIAVALAMFVPFVFSLATSLKTNVEANTLTWATMLWPANPTLDAYRTLAATPKRCCHSPPA